MKVLYFDTETNGLPKVRGGSDTDVKNHPEAVEIAWQIWENGVLVKRRSALIRPDPSIVWDAGSAAIHKIFKPFALANGTPGADVFEEFKADCRTCDAIVAHNLAFDLPVVKCACLRLWPADSDFSWLPAKQICTMKLTIGVCKLPFVNSKFPRREGDYKQPRLAELHRFLFSDEGSYEAHRAASDVDCLVACSNELMRRNILVL
jgi:DNA polymerase III epsilon subunit-like protein